MSRNWENWKTNLFVYVHYFSGNNQFRFTKFQENFQASWIQIKKKYSNQIFAKVLLLNFDAKKNF